MARGYEPFSNCRICGNRILWVKTPAGKNMPVDPNLINYRAVPGGKGKDSYTGRRSNSRRKMQSGRRRRGGIHFPLRHLRKIKKRGDKKIWTRKKRPWN